MSSPSKSVYTKATSDPLSLEEQKEQDYYDEEGDDVAQDLLEHYCSEDSVMNKSHLTYLQKEQRKRNIDDLNPLKELKGFLMKKSPHVISMWQVFYTYN